MYIKVYLQNFCLTPYAIMVDFKAVQSSHSVSWMAIFDISVPPLNQQKRPHKQFKCFTFERNAKTTITYDLSRVRGNSCQVIVTTAVEENNGQSRSTYYEDSKPCSYVPECFSQGKSKFKNVYFFFLL